VVDPAPPAELAVFLQKWCLSVTGAAFRTPTSWLIPVERAKGSPAILKISGDPDESRGAALMAWWSDIGAPVAPVLAQGAGALLMEYAGGARSLDVLVQTGDDSGATRILCDIVGRLHGAASRPQLPLTPLDQWFSDLTETHPLEMWLEHSAHDARALLRSTTHPTVLHGDLHHGNILDFGASNWRVIDPKGLWGDGAFDLAPMFLNPDLATPELTHARDAERFAARLSQVVQNSGVLRSRLLGWIRAWCGLSAIWFMEQGTEPVVQARIFDLALQQDQSP